MTIVHTIPEVPRYAMKRVCMVCNKHLGWKQCTPDQAGQVTHGCCEACAEQLLRDAAELKATR